MKLLTKFVFFCVYCLHLEQTHEFHLGAHVNQEKDVPLKENYIRHPLDTFTTIDMAWHPWTPPPTTPDRSNRTTTDIYLLPYYYYDSYETTPRFRNLSWPSKELLKDDLQHYFGYTFKKKYLKFYQWYHKFMLDQDNLNDSRYDRDIGDNRWPNNTVDYDSWLRRSSFPIPLDKRIMYAHVEMRYPTKSPEEKWRETWKNYTKKRWPTLITIMNW